MLAGVSALVLVLLVTVLVVWRTTDSPARTTAAGTTDPAAVLGSTTPATSGLSRAPSSAASSSATVPTPTGATATTRPARQPTTAPTSNAVAVQQQAAPGPTFSAIIGEDCPQNNATEHVSDSGSSAWNRHSGADGCGGSFYAAASVSGNNSFYWWFTTGAVSSGQCDVRVFVPAGGSLASANPASYQVYTGSAGSYATSFTVDQRDNQGAWVPAATVPVSGASVEIRLTADGSGSGSMAAGAVSISCHL